MRVVLAGYYGFGNGGDEALLTSALQMLPAEAEPIVLSPVPTQTSETYSVASINRWDGVGIQRVLRHSTAFVWGGGSLMQDRTSWRNPLYYGGLMGLAQRFGLKTIAWAQGIGPLQQRWTRWITRQCLQRCTAVSVRDRVSSQLLSDWQIPHVLAPDPVWALAATPMARTIDVRPTLANRPAIAVALRSHPLLTNTRLETIARGLVQLQAETETRIHFIPFQPRADLAIAQRLHRQLGDVSSVVDIDDPRQLKGALRETRLTISMRYHGLVMAAAEGVPIFGLSYDPKVERLLQELDAPGWDLADLPTDPHQICQAWRNCYEHHSALSSAQLSEWRQRALQHQQVFVNGLQNHPSN
ncbi:MAG: polysaccharide pyruvyl transferase CsaB [Cyanobacteria bacterium P01_F01_bin.33]